MAWPKQRRFDFELLRKYDYLTSAGLFYHFSCYQAVPSLLIKISLPGKMSENKLTEGSDKGQSISSQQPMNVQEIWEELRRVMEVSRKVWTTAEAIINAESGFLRPLRAVAIDTKVDTWVNKYRPALEEAYPNHPERNERYLKMIASKVKERICKDYLNTYRHLRDHLITVNKLAQLHRKIHLALPKMEAHLQQEPCKFRRFLDLLSGKVSDGLLAVRVLDFKGRLLHRQFLSRMLETDIEAIRWCREKVAEFIEEKEGS